MGGREVRALLIALALVGLCGCPGGGLSGEAPLPPLPLKGTWHTVAAGETVADLASRYGVAATDIEEINGLDRRQVPAVGDRVFVPGIERKGARPSGKDGKGKRNGKGKVSSFELLWPVSKGTLSSGYGRRGGKPHEGIDIRAPRGTAILAAADGTVMYAGDGVRGYGNMIIVRHTGGLVTVYAHNHRNHVNEGVKVTRGQVIGEVGSSGRATGTHLHFEVRRGETPVDPLGHVQQP